jgi:hypothetical protein
MGYAAAYALVFEGCFCPRRMNPKSLGVIETSFGNARFRPKAEPEA